jgi:hypothetical protein
MLRFALIVFILLTPPFTAEANSDKAKDFSDTIAGYLKDGRNIELYVRSAPEIQKEVTQKQFDAVITSMSATFGTIQSFTFKSESQGSKTFAGTKVPIQKFWYSVITTKFSKGFFLFVEVTQSEPYRTTGFSIVTFPGGPPSFLK